MDISSYKDARTHLKITPIIVVVVDIVVIVVVDVVIIVADVVFIVVDMVIIFIVDTFMVDTMVLKNEIQIHVLFICALFFHFFLNKSYNTIHFNTNSFYMRTCIPYKRVCPSICLLVCPSVLRSVP